MENNLKSHYDEYTNVQHEKLVSCHLMIGATPENDFTGLCQTRNDQNYVSERPSRNYVYDHIFFKKLIANQFTAARYDNVCCTLDT